MTKTVLFALATLLAIPSFAAETPYNLLFISLDTVRADRLGCYGYARDTSPNIDALAKRGTRFTDCLSPLPLTLPAHSTMMTGLHPAKHGLLENNFYAGDALVFLAEIATAGGFQTRAFLGAPFLTEKYNFTQGFEAAEAFLKHPLKIRGGKTVDRFETWLRDERDEDKPFFSFVHFYDVHEPYGAPPPFENQFSVPGASRKQMVLRDIQGRLKGEWREKGHYASDPELYTLNAKYDEGIVYVDLQVQRLLDALEAEGIADRTIIILTSDHGEGLGDFKNDFYHGATVFQNTLHVPLIIVHPDHPAGQTSDAPVNLADLFPTALEFMALDNPGTAERAQDLTDIVSGEAASTEALAERHRFSRSSPDGGTNVRYGVVQAGDKLILDEQTDAVSWWRMQLQEPLKGLEQIRLAVDSPYRVELALEIGFGERSRLIRFPSVTPGLWGFNAWADAREASEDGWITYTSTPVQEALSEGERTKARIIGIRVNLGSASRFEGSFDNLEFRYGDKWRLIRSFENAATPQFAYIPHNSHFDAGKPVVVSHILDKEHAQDGKVSERFVLEFPKHPFARHVYNLAVDPWEQRNIFHLAPEVTTALEPALRNFFEDSGAGVSKVQLKDAETMQELESLGYL